jgi:hypothetical protein
LFDEFPDPTDAAYTLFPRAKVSRIIEIAKEKTLFEQTTALFVTTLHSINKEDRV